MEKLNIAYIQANLVWENSAANLKMLENHFDKIENTDIVVLPEMFNTGFTMNVKGQAQLPAGDVMQWLKLKAKEHNFAIMGSTIINDGGKYYNRFFMVTPQGSTEQYDKRHLFRMGDEHKNFTAGNKLQTFNYLGWRIRPLICYDLRFPVWSRNKNNYDLLIYVANWPKARREVWKTLLKARAIENQCYVIGVNRVGNDGMGIEYSGDSVVIDPKGSTISQLPENNEATGTASISLSELQVFRSKFPVHFDADDFTIL